MKRTNQAQQNRGSAKVRQSKTPAAITSLKNNVVIENEDKENQNPSGVSKRISFPSPNSKEKIQPEDSNNIKHNNHGWAVIKYYVCILFKKKY